MEQLKLTMYSAHRGGNMGQGVVAMLIEKDNGGAHAPRAGEAHPRGISAVPAYLLDDKYALAGMQLLRCVPTGQGLAGVESVADGERFLGKTPIERRQSRTIEERHLIFVNLDSRTINL